MAVSVTGIVINVILILIIIGLLVATLTLNGELKRCESEQSPYCYNIHCPCDSTSTGPCFGYAQMPTGTPGQWRCSNSPQTVVDDDGNIV